MKGCGDFASWSCSQAYEQENMVPRISLHSLTISPSLTTNRKICYQVSLPSLTIRLDKSRKVVPDLLPVLFLSSLIILPQSKYLSAV